MTSELFGTIHEPPAGLARAPWAASIPRADLVGDVRRLWIENDRGMRLGAMEYGATLTDLLVPSAGGTSTNVVLGYESLDGYLAGSGFIGAVAGRVAGRISGARFDLGGKAYELEANDPPNALHSGSAAIDKRIWAGEAVSDRRGPAIAFSLLSPTGDCGFPGEVAFRVRYVLPHGSTEVIVEISAMASEDTPLNPIHHAYFNLDGGNGTDVLDHDLAIYADWYTPTDDAMGLCGRRDRVNGTAANVRTPTRMRDVVAVIHQGHGDNYLIRRPVAASDQSGQLALAARAVSPASGISLEVFTTASYLQFYSGISLDESGARGGGSYGAHQGFCLEAQEYPDGMRSPDLGDIVYGPGKAFQQRTAWRFSHLEDG